MGRGLLFAALSGLGQGIAQSAERDERVRIEKEMQDKRIMDEKGMMAERARIEEEKAIRITEKKNQMERDEALKRGREIDSEVERRQNQRDADSINQKYGSSMTADDAKSLRGNEEARKAYGLSASDRMSNLKDRADAAESLGYTESARESRGQMKIEADERRIDNAEKRAAFMEKYQMAREARLDRLSAVQLDFQKSRADREDARVDLQEKREQRAATATALKSVQDDIKSLAKEMESGMIPEAEMPTAKRTLEALKLDQVRYRKALEKSGLDIGEAEPKGVETPSAAKIQLLLANPDKAADFDAKYGEGMAAKYLKMEGSATSKPQAAPAAQLDKRQDVRSLAIEGLTKGMEETARQIAAANRRGDQVEVQRLLAQLEEQKQAKIRADQ
jgi:hypothetical protein